MDYTNARNDYIAGIFDRAAQTYSSIGPGYFTYFGQKLVEHLSINPGTTLLDIACGRGAILFPASDATGPQGKALGIDFSHNMIKETQNSIFDKGYSHTFVQHMNAEELLFEDYSFDTVTCGFAIQFFANYQRALKEMHRVLKPNGKIGISSWKRPEAKSIIARIFPKYFPQNDSQPSTEPNPEFGIPYALEEMFLSAGFKNIIVTEQSKRFYYRDEEHWWQDQWSHGGRIYLEAVEKLGSDAIESFRKDVTNELKETTDENGIYINANALFVIANK